MKEFTYNFIELHLFMITNIIPFILTCDNKTKYAKTVMIDNNHSSSNIISIGNGIRAYKANYHVIGAVGHVL